MPDTSSGDPAPGTASPATEDIHADDQPSRWPAAIVFVQGLSVGLGPSKTAAGVMTNIENACESQSEAAASFAVQWHDAAVRDKSAGLVATLLRTDGGREEPVLDLYSYEWSEPFVKTWRDQNVFVRLVKIVFALSKVFAFVRFFRSSGKKNPFGRAQLIVAASIVLILGSYAVVTAYAAYQVVDAVAHSTVGDKTKSAAPPSSGPVSSEPVIGEATRLDGTNDGSTSNSNGLTWQQWVAVVGGLALVFLRRARTGIVTAGEVLAAAHGYLQIGEGGPRAAAGLEKLIEQVSIPSKDRSIAIVAYSFGSLVAIDTLFPTTGPPPTVTDRVGTLVTIGTPFDFAQAVHPKWTETRHTGPGTLTRWVNIYSSIDLLGSNFLENGSGQERELSVVGSNSKRKGRRSDIASVPEVPGIARPTESVSWTRNVTPSLVNLLAFHGFSSHGQYWSESAAPETGVFQEVIRRLYKNNEKDAAILAPPASK